MEKLLLTFLLLFKELKYGKSSLFCCNGYRYALFKIIFLWISSRYLRKALTKEKREEKNVNYLVPEVTLIQNSKMDIVIEFQVSIFKNYEVRAGEKKLSPQMWNKLAQRQRWLGLI